MDKPKSEQRIIAFVDILGFKNFMQSPNLDDNNIVNLLCLQRQMNQIGSKEKIYLDTLSGPYPTERINPSINSYSDHTLISSDIDPNSKQNICNSFIYICQRVIDFQRLALSKGYALRGAIAYGDMIYDDDNNIFIGKPLIDAIEAENCLAIYPRVVLTTSMQNCLSSADLGAHTFTKKDFDELIFVNFLRDESDNKSPFKMLTAIRKSIIEKIENETLHLKISTKWHWLANYFNGSLVNYKQIDDAQKNQLLIQLK